MKKRIALFVTVVASCLLSGCIIEVVGSSRHSQHSGDHPYDENSCPYYENAPYSYDPDSCETSPHRDCCLWEVEERYGRTCQEYWCYSYEDCYWYYERILCS